MQEKYDIAIIGGGMVGASLAVALSRSSLNILLVDGQRFKHSPPVTDYDIRVSAITRASKNFLKSLGVWQDIKDFRASPFREMHVWEGQQDSVIHFDGADIGEEELGYIIENRVIQYYLHDRIRKAENIDFVDRNSIASFESISDDEIQVNLSTGKQFNCQLLVGADGNRSTVRELAGIEAKGWQYDQSAVVATVKTSKSHENTAWQCFLVDGPLAFLPLDDNLSSIVWSTRPDRATELKSVPVDQFELQLEQAFEGRLGEVELIGERGVFPLQLKYAEHYVEKNVALIGDAAHSIHPLAGQGVNLGFLDAACLADVILDGVSRSKPLGSYALLRRYERWRKGDNLGMMFMMDAFKRIFAVESGPLKKLRGKGLQLTNAIEPLKKLIMQGAAGMRGELPSMIKNK